MAAERVLDDVGGPGMLVVDLGVRTAVKSWLLLLRERRPAVVLGVVAAVGLAV